jgi:hypothetical protein
VTLGLENSVLRPREPSSIFGKRLKQAGLDVDPPQKEPGILAGVGPLLASTRANRCALDVQAPDQTMTRCFAKALGVPPVYLHATPNGLLK